MLEVIRILGDVAPQSFNLEDNSGRNAIEVAIENDADIEIIKAIQRDAIAHEKSTKDRKCNENKEQEVIVSKPRMPARMASFCPGQRRGSWLNNYLQPDRFVQIENTGIKLGLVY